MVFAKMKCRNELNAQNMTVAPYPMTQEKQYSDGQTYVKQKLKTHPKIKQ